MPRARSGRALTSAVAGLVVCVGVLLVSAAPAGAHAVLLGSEPSPQSTVSEAPGAVRLEFSEPVETAFGAVRVYDVDGRRVDGGAVRRAGRGDVLEVPVTAPDGTFTVTWRVVSSDGHRIRGGFVFYVGAPSTISPVAIDDEAGAGPVVGWTYGVVRFLWFGALIAMVGIAVARRAVWTPSVRVLGLEREPLARAFRSRTDRALPMAWLVLVLAGGASIVFQAATVAGLSLGDAVSATVIEEVLDTTFGRAWLVQTVLALLTIVPIVALGRRRPLPGPPSLWLGVLALLVVGMSVTTAVSGHARTDPNPLLAQTSVVVHLLAVAAWAGGVLALVGLAGPAWRSLDADERPPLLREVVGRFNRVAVIAVVVVAVTGTVNAVTAMAGVSDLWTTTYGRVVAAKVGLLVVALGLAARHTRRRLRAFTRAGRAELLVLTAAVALAAALVALVPGRSLALAEQGPVAVERRAGPYTVQLFVDPSSVGANEIHVTFVGEGGLAATEVTTTSVRLTAPERSATTVPMRLIAPGHFAGDADLPAAGAYRLAVTTPVDGGPARTEFRFTISRRD